VEEEESRVGDGEATRAFFFFGEEGVSVVAGLSADDGGGEADRLRPRFFGEASGASVLVGVLSALSEDDEVDEEEEDDEAGVDFGLKNALIDGCFFANLATKRAAIFGTAGTSLNEG